MIPASLWAIHWTDTKRGGGGLIQEYGRSAPMIWTTRADVEYYMSRVQLNIEQRCEVVEYVLRPTAGGEGL